MNDEHAMLLYARLAALSAARQQSQGQVWFLVLTGMAATRAGWPAVAERCQERIRTLAPHHVLTRYQSFAEALRDPDFRPFARRLQRLCPVERAEHLLRRFEGDAEHLESGPSAGEAALTLLS